ncbi:MAG: flagellar basal body P-ring formation chaperone FlgA [Halothiobacillus sp.]
MSEQVNPKAPAHTHRMSAYSRAFGLAVLICSGWAAGGIPAVWADGPTTAHAEFQSAQSIESAIQSFLKQQVAIGTNTQFQVSTLDPRLQLKPCDQPLRVQTNNAGIPHGGRMTVQVACTGANPWRIFVPVKIMTLVTVLSLARPLAPGAQITAQDLSSLVVNANQQTSAYLVNPADAIGQVVTRPMQAGQILTQQDLNAAQVIKRGDHVTLIAGEDGVSVSAEGVAQDSAGIGQRVLVKNSRSGAQVEGIVRDAHTVVIR